MAPMTRCRATAQHIPTEIMTQYYAMRASAGLIITEGVGPSLNGTGYARIPGIYNEAQKLGWKSVAKAVHENGGKIFMQLMHCGRVSHSLNMEPGSRILAPSALAHQGKLYTDSKGEQECPVPEAMTLNDIAETKREFFNATKMALEAGMDGVELHAANGYLIEQFLRPCSNQRNDAYGKDRYGRTRFLMELVSDLQTLNAPQKVGVRLSPFGVFNGMQDYESMAEDYLWLAQELKSRVAYLHIVDHSSMGAPEVPKTFKRNMKTAFGGPIILCGGYDAQTAQRDLDDSLCDLVAVGRPFISNPRLLNQWKEGAPLEAPQFATFYTPGPAGYI